MSLNLHCKLEEEGVEGNKNRTLVKDKEEEIEYRTSFES